MSKVAYEPHPVTPERKAELRKQGKIIVDVIYKPADLIAEDAGQDMPELTPEAVDAMSRKELVETLEVHGVEGATGKVKDLRNWVKQVVFI